MLRGITKFRCFPCLSLNIPPCKMGLLTEWKWGRGGVQEAEEEKEGEGGMPCWGAARGAQRRGVGAFPATPGESAAAVAVMMFMPREGGDDMSWNKLLLSSLERETGSWGQ